MRTSISKYLPPVTAGFIAVLVGFTRTVALVYKAAMMSGADLNGAVSWISALCFGSGVASIYFSLKYKMPILLAWSTPGSALLILSSGYSLEELTGAFLLNGILAVIAGSTGAFEKVISKVPISLASAMLAGILLKFGLDVFTSMQSQVGLVLGIFAVYLIAKRIAPRYAIMLVFLSGIALAGFQDLLHIERVTLALPTLSFTLPQFSFGALLGIGLPLFIVTMASQNIPGVAALRGAGYFPPISPIITGTGLLTVLLAPFGGFSINLAAITAAICMGKEAHEDKGKRYQASVSAGVFYLILAALAGSIGVILAGLPKELIFAVAGLALFSTIGNSLYQSMKDEKEREPALITFLVTASGLSFFGIGSAFWGILIGITAFLLLTKKSEK